MCAADHKLGLKYFAFGVYLMKVIVSKILCIWYISWRKQNGVTDEDMKVIVSK